MEININKMHNAVPSMGNIQSSAGPVPTAGKEAQRDIGPAVTITRAEQGPTEIGISNVPDAALDRNDALGRLISSAFNMPPPPMPAFD